MHLINLCNCNTGKVKIDVLNSMFVLIEKFDTNKKKPANYGGDFNLRLTQSYMHKFGILL